VAEVDLVEIEFENLLFGQFLFDVQGKDDLPDLARESALTGEVEIARHLHSDGTASLAFLSRGDESDRCTHQAQRIDAMMDEEVLIFSGQEGIHHLFRDLVVTGRIAALFPILGDQLVVGAVDSQGHLQLNFPEVVDGGNLATEMEIGAHPHACGKKDAEEGQEESVLENFPWPGHLLFRGRSKGRRLYQLPVGFCCYTRFHHGGVARIAGQASL